MRESDTVELPVVSACDFRDLRDQIQAERRDRLRIDCVPGKSPLIPIPEAGCPIDTVVKPCNLMCLIWRRMPNVQFSIRLDGKPEGCVKVTLREDQSLKDARGRIEQVVCS